MKRILIVDDDPAIRRALSRVLTRPNVEWETQAAADAKEARQLLASGTRFDAIVSDLNMPNEDGELLLRYVMTEYPNIIRVVLSGDVHTAWAHERVTSLCHRLLSSSCPPELLYAALEEITAARATS